MPAKRITTADPIFALIEEAKRLWAIADDAAEREMSAEEEDAATIVAGDAMDRVQDAKATTLRGVVAQIEFLVIANAGFEKDKDRDIALDALRKIAAKHPDLVLA